MAEISLTQAQTQLDAYIAAEILVLGGRAYSQGGMSFTRADLKTIRDGIDYWNEKVKELTAAASRSGITLTCGEGTYAR